MKNKIFILLAVLGIVLYSNNIKEENINENTKKIVLSNVRSKKIDYKVLYGYTNKWWTVYNNKVLNETIDTAFESGTSVKSLQKKLMEIQNNFNKNSTVEKKEFNTERMNENSNEVNLISGANIKPEDINFQLIYPNDLINRLENLTLNKTHNLEALEIEAKWASNSISMSVIKLYSYYIYLHEEEKNLKERKEVLEELEKFEEIKLNLKRSSGADLIKVQELKAEVNSMLIENNLNKQITEKSLESLLGNNKGSLKNILESGKRETDLLKVFSSFEIPEKINSDDIRERTDMRFYLVLLKEEKENLLPFKVTVYPNFWISGEKEEITTYEQVEKKERLQNSLYFQRYEGNEIFNKKKSFELSRLFKQYNSAILGAYNSVNYYLGNTKKTLNDLEKNTQKLKEQNNVMQDKKNKLDAGVISKYDYSKLRYAFLIQKLYNLQLEFNLSVQEADLMYNLGGGLNEADTKQ